LTGAYPTASRRTLLRAGLSAAAAAGLPTAAAGCSAADRPTQVAVIWSGQELALFHEVLRGYPGPLEVLSAGDDIDAFLSARHRAGTSPDVAIVSRPGLITDYARRGWLAELPEDLAAPFPAGWRDLLRVDGRLYGAWVKAAFKSLFWYLPSIMDSRPQTWDALVDQVTRIGAAALSGRGAPAPLAIGAADGWVLTDWFENVLAAVAPAGFYESLARGEPGWTDPAVRDSLDLLAQLWSRPGAFVGGPGRALLTQFEESVIQMTSGRAAMVFEADFVQAVVDQFQESGVPAPQTFRFPVVAGVLPLVVGGDAAVVLRGSPRGETLLRYLTGAYTFDPWIRAGGYLSPNLGVSTDRYPDGLARDLATEMRDGPLLRFDLSDRLTGSFGGADGVGMWQILQDFFQAVTATHADAAGAVTDTVRRLDRAARQAAADGARR
jgi:ABC-type glycerol-3-phosphate transport system substrate-binding protein